MKLLGKRRDRQYFLKNEKMTLDDLILEGQNVLETKWAGGFNTYVDSDVYEI